MFLELKEGHDMRDTSEVPHEFMVGLINETVMVAGSKPDGGFVVPLRVAHVSLPTHRGHMTAFTADLVGPRGMALSEAGRYSMQVRGRRFDLTLSWVRVQPDATFCRATFVHPLVGSDVTAPLDTRAGARKEPSPLRETSETSGIDHLTSLVRQWVELSSVFAARSRVLAVASTGDSARHQSPDVGARDSDDAGDPSVPAATPGTDVSSERLFVFVRGRLGERAALAAEAGDELMQRFTDWEVDWVDHAWSDAAPHPHQVAEVERYLLRTAQRYRRHPQFDLDWRLPVTVQSTTETMATATATDAETVGSEA